MINDLFKNIDFDQTDIFSGLNTEGKALLVNTLFKKYKSITIVTNTLFEANKLYQSISNYNDNVLLFPMDDFLTSEAIAISPELKINRLETLNELCNSTHNIVITNLMGYLRFLPTLDNYKKKNIFIKKDEDISFDDLIKKLVDLGYTRETIVNKTGEFSVRGFVIDIFPISFTDPIRVEFWGDTVDKIKFFNTNTQRTTKEIKDITIYPNTEFLVEKEIDKFLLKQKDLPLYTDTTNISSFFNSIVIFDDFQQLQTPIMIILFIGYYLAVMAGMFKGSFFITGLSFVPFISAILAPSLFMIDQIGVYHVIGSIVIMIFTNYLLII